MDIRETVANIWMKLFFYYNRRSDAAVLLFVT